MSRRIVVITEIIAPYRIPVLNALAQIPNIDPKVIFLAENDRRLREWHVYKEELQFSYQVLSSWRVPLPNSSLLLNWGMTAALRSYSPEAIVCGGYNDPADWQAWLWARRNGVPFFSWVESNTHDRRTGTAVVESLKRRFLRGCRGVVVPGKASANYVESLGVTSDAVFTAPNAVDNNLYTNGAAQIRAQPDLPRSTLALPERYFLFVGRLVPEKGVFDLLDAYGRLAVEIRERVALVLVGEGGARGELEMKARTIAPGRIMFRGFKQRNQLIAEYALAELFIFPTHTDPWGLVVNEAMACGLPVIVTDVAGCSKDLIEEDGNGYVVPARDPAELARAMAAIVCNRERRARMGKRSLEIIANYSPERCAAGLAKAASSGWGSNAS